MADFLTTLCGKVTFHGVTVEIRQGKALNLDCKEAVLVHPFKDKVELCRRAGDKVMNDFHNSKETPYELNTLHEDVDFRISEGYNLRAPKIFFINVPGIARETPEFAEEDKTVTCLFYLMLEAAKNEASKILIPFIKGNTNRSFPSEAAAKLHLQTYIVYAQKHKERSLKTIVFVTENNSDTEAFLNQILEFANVFPEIEYMGSPGEQAQAPGFYQCRLCSITSEQFTACPNCNNICNYCIFQHSIATCDCGTPMNYDFSLIICRICNNAKTPSHKCRLVCNECPGSLDGPICYYCGESRA